LRLNFTLAVGGIDKSVEVTVAADTLLATSSLSIGWRRLSLPVS
jgi:hypothetical protein